MPCRELRFVLSVVFYVVNENLQNRIRSKSCKKQKKTPETVGFQVLFWSCWADSNRRPHPYQVFRTTCLYCCLFMFFKNSLLSANIYLQIAHHAETGVCTALFAK